MHKSVFTVALVVALVSVGGWISQISQHETRVPHLTEAQLAKINAQLDNLPDSAEWAEVKSTADAARDELKDVWKFVIKNTEDISANKEWFASVQGYIMGRFENLRDNLISPPDHTD